MKCDAPRLPGGPKRAPLKTVPRLGGAGMGGDRGAMAPHRPAGHRCELQVAKAWQAEML